MNPYLELLAGVACAFVGGELFVRGIVGISNWLRIPKAVAAVSLAAFATSSPEAAVGITAALANEVPIALGDALGSNIVNIGLILGIALCIAPMPCHWQQIRRDFLVALAAPLAILLFLLNGQFTRPEAMSCLILFTTWLVYTIRHARNNRTEPLARATPRQGAIAITLTLLGLAVLILAGRLIVSGGVEIGRLWNLNTFLVGATLVAFGTSAPELATVIIARLRGHDDIGIGTLLGSNIFNCLFIIGLAAYIAPFEEPLPHVLASLIFGILTLLALLPLKGNLLGRGRGLLLLALYALSIFAAWLTQQRINQ